MGNRVLLPLLFLLAGNALSAQPAAPWRLVVDNDYFNFWRPESRRPDNDYTQGVRVEAPARWILALVGRESGSCGIPNQARSRCVAGVFGMRQEIYTPERDSVQLAPGQRPYLGWLSASATIRWISLKDVEDVSLEIGVTGRPSFAEGSQKIVHRLLGFREPLGWDGQLPFEPGFVISYDRARLLAQVTSGGARILGMNADARIRVGNVATDLRAGGCFTLGWNVNACHSAWGQLRRGFGIGLVAGLHGDLVLHNLSLDGSTFTGGPRVSKKMAVAEGMVGIKLQFKGLVLGWTAIHRGKEYDTQAKSHTFSRISLSF